MKNVIVAVFFILFISESSAQSILYDYGQQSHLRLELNRPIFKNEAGSSFGLLSFGGILNGHFKVGSKNTFAVEFPFSRSAIENTDSESGIGNIGLAFQLRNISNDNFFEIGLRLPTASENLFGITFGVLSDYAEKFTSYQQDFFALSGNYIYNSNAGIGGYLRVKPGLTILFPSEEGLDIEALLNLNVAGGFRSASIDVNVGFMAVGVLSEEDLGIAGRTLGMLFTTFTYTAGSFQPGLVFRLPLDADILDVYSIVAGVSLNYNFSRKVEAEPTN